MLQQICHMIIDLFFFFHGFGTTPIWMFFPPTFTVLCFGTCFCYSHSPVLDLYSLFLDLKVFCFFLSWLDSVFEIYLHWFLKKGYLQGNFWVFGYMKYLCPTCIIVWLSIESPGEKNQIFSAFWRLLYCPLVSTIASLYFVIPFLHFLPCLLFLSSYLSWFAMSWCCGFHELLRSFGLFNMEIHAFGFWEDASIFILLISSLLFSSFSSGTPVG